MVEEVQLKNLLRDVDNGGGGSGGGSGKIRNGRNNSSIDAFFYWYL